MEQKIVYNKESYIKVGNDKIINEKYIKWVRKMNECLEVCTKSNGCNGVIDTHKICKIDNLKSYDKLNKLFE
jgi:hypothetical protein